MKKIIIVAIPRARKNSIAGFNQLLNLKTKSERVNLKKKDYDNIFLLNMILNVM